MAKTKIEIKRDSKNDEPLEDSLAANRDKYTKAITDAKGNFTIAKIADGKYFVYAEPSDKNYLPGGDKSNKSMDASELRGKTIKILISGNPPLNAAYVGTSKCLLCHKAYETEKRHCISSASGLPARTASFRTHLILLSLKNIETAIRFYPAQTAIILMV